MRAKDAIKEKVKRNKDILQETKKRIQDHASFLHQKPGELEAQEGDFTLRYTQDELRDLLPEGNRHQVRLNLEHGPYHCSMTRNGQHLVLGGERGQVAVFNWRTKELGCEFSVKEKVRDVCFLHNETMFAVAQKKHVFIYDNSGLELHCLKQNLHPLFLDFLPYHFLLVSASKAGFIKYHDTSTGTLISEHRTKLGRPQAMSQNPFNAVMGLGHSNGIVSMWTPNSSVPVIKVLAHSAPLTSLSFESQGRYLATTGLDGRLKLWDIRKFKDTPVHDYWVPGVPQNTNISQRGMVAVSFRNQIQIWKDSFVQKQKMPYMKHKVKGNSKAAGLIKDLSFVPFQDFLVLGYTEGVQSIVVPGSGEPNYDAMEVNPFESKTQRRERQVHQLLQKLQPDSIVLEPETVGRIDKASAEVLQKEKLEEIEHSLAHKLQSKKVKKAMKKAQSSKKKRDALSKQNMRDKMREKALKQYEEQQKEDQVLQTELNLLSKLEKPGQFEPFSQVLKQAEPAVRKKKRYVAPDN